MEGYKLLERTLMLAAELRQQINSTGVFRVLELEDLLPEQVRADNIASIDQDHGGHLACGMTVDELQQSYLPDSTSPSKNPFNTITLLLTIGTTRSKCSRLYDP